jgi:hypothetical protein
MRGGAYQFRHCSDFGIWGIAATVPFFPSLSHLRTVRFGMSANLWPLAQSARGAEFGSWSLFPHFESFRHCSVLTRAIRECHAVTLGDLPGNPVVQPPLGQLVLRGLVVVSTSLTTGVILVFPDDSLQLRYGLISNYLIDVTRFRSVQKVHMLLCGIRLPESFSAPWGISATGAFSSSWGIWIMESFSPSHPEKFRA